jgi:uncharacterized membrane protein
MGIDHHTILNLFHILFVSPLLIYIGIQRASSPEWLYKALIILSILVFAYHLFRLYTKWIKGSSSLWVNLIHILLVAPVLFIIGYYKKETTRAFFEATLLLGFAALGYNIYNLVLQLNTVTGDSN